MDTGSAIAAVVGGERPSPIGILRISGDRLQAGGLKFLQPKDQLPTTAKERHRSVALCDFVLSDGSVLDTCLVSFFWAPQSYTGQDVIEIAMHGNPILLRDGLSEVGKHGIRPAGPGEFTMRAYLNGKLDLSQAEAVHDLVMAQNRFALEKSRHNLQGFVKREMSKLRSFLLNLKADLEAELDFMDQDIEFIDRTETIERTNQLRSMIDGLLASGRRGRQLSAGLWTVITGEPNVGKSTLLNLLLGYDRAIVSDIPGTTRDYLAEEVLIGDHSLKIFDTAGIRADAADPVETQGIARSKELREKANLHIEVVDVQTCQWPTNEAGPLSSGNNSSGYNQVSGRIVLRIYNKADLAEHSKLPELNTLYTIAQGHSNSSDVGLPEAGGSPSTGTPGKAGTPGGGEYSYGFVTSLVAASGTGRGDTGRLIADIIEQVLDLHFSTKEGILLSERAEFFLAEAESELAQVVSLAEAGESPEYMCVHLDRVMESIGDITGRIDTEEVLGRIFSRFCIGK